MTYAVCLARNPLTGDTSTVAATNALRRATSPALEQVLIILRTQLGSCAAMPALGVDWRRLDKLRTSAQADAESAIRAGLALLVRAGTISGLTVTVTVRAAIGRLTYEVSFVDVLLQQRVTTGVLTQ